VGPSIPSIPTFPCPPLFPHQLPFGDPLPSPKLDSSFCISFCNIGGFLALTKNNDKVLDLQHFLTSVEIDVFNRCESNLNWRVLPDHLQIKEWFHSADGCHSFAANNIHKQFGNFQFGGMFWIAAGHASCHITKSDKDLCNLGHWVSCSLKGHSGKGLTIIFAYHPCSNLAMRFCSIYTQQKCHFKLLNRPVCPRIAFLDDLATFIAT